MKNIMKAYVNDYLIKNKKLTILLFVILFLIFPFITFNINLVSHNTNASYYLVGMLCATACTLAFLLPLYNFKFMMKKRSSELYFSLPIKRSKLFNIQYLIGLIYLWVPVTINYVIGIFIVYLFNGFQVNGSISFSACWLFSFVFITILYTMFTFLCIKCNTLIDAFVILSCYVVFPILIFLSFDLFFNNNIDKILVSYSYAGSEVFDTNFICGLLSLPSFIADSVIYLFLNGGGDSPTLNTLFFSIYWIIIGLLCGYYGRKSFINRKGEDAEQMTTSLVTFPLIILIFTFCAVLMISIMEESTWIALSIVFLIYLIFSFFAKRNMKLTPMVIIKFLIIVICVNVFSFIFVETSAFNIIQEVPSANDIDSIELGINFGAGYDEEGLYAPTKVIEADESKSSVIESISLYVVQSTKMKDKQLIDEIVVFNNKLKDQMEVLEKDSKKQSFMSSDGGYTQRYCVDITYHMKNDTIVQRGYNVSDEFQKDVDEMFDYLLDKGLIDLYSDVQNVVINYK